MQLFGTMEKGNMVPNDEVITLLAEAMEKRTDAEGFTIDGFPANMEQAEMFESRLGSPSKIVVLDLNDEVNADQDKDAVFNEICKLLES